VLNYYDTVSAINQFLQNFNQLAHIFVMEPDYRRSTLRDTTRLESFRLRARRHQIPR
jgi:hypothetical protein